MKDHAVSYALTLSTLSLVIVGNVLAQAPVSGLAARKAPTSENAPTTSGGASTEHDNALRLSIPGGAGAAVNDGATGAAGPLIGFQVWKLDNYLISTFFAFAPTQDLAGTKRDFGSFLLTPPGRGASFSLAGSKVFPLFCSPAPTEGSSCPVSHARLFMGFGGRTGITNTTWKDGTGDNATSVSGSVGYFTPSFVVTSKTYSFTDSDTNDTNEYQFGLLSGYGFRHITGDLGFSSSADFRRKVVGTDRTTLKGLEFEFFVRMNSFRPYFRYSRFQLPKGTDLEGLSGGQVVFGVDVLSSIFLKTLQ